MGFIHLTLYFTVALDNLCFFTKSGREITVPTIWVTVKLL